MKKEKQNRIKNVALVYSKKSIEKNRSVLIDVKDILRDEDVLFSSTQVDKIKPELFEKVDLVITVGGDGTFICASHFLENQIILGINSDSKTSEGGLLVLNEYNLEKLRKVLNGKFSVFNRKRIVVLLNDKIISGRALNEVYFGALNQFHTSRYKLILGSKIEEQRSSGVLVVTATGSRAWYKSAGGKPFYRRGILKYLVREPFVSRIFKSKLLRGKVGSNINFVSTMHNDAVISLDSNLTIPIYFGDKIEMALAKCDLRCVKI